MSGKDAMTGPEHYAEALSLLAAGAESGEYGARHAYAQAQIHAALAVAATFGTETAYGSTSREMRETRAPWAAVLGSDK
jgi:hypothetical protein